MDGVHNLFDSAGSPWTPGSGLWSAEISSLPRLACPACDKEFQSEEMVEQRTPDTEDERGEVFAYLHICACGQLLQVFND